MQPFCTGVIVLFLLKVSDRWILIIKFALICHDVRGNRYMLFLMSDVAWILNL